MSQLRAGGRWVEGNTGNPGGRPKEVEDVREAARKHTTEAIQRLVEWMRSDNPRASVAACEELLERGWGRAEQRMEHSGSIDFAGIRERVREKMMRLPEAAIEEDEVPPVTH